MHLEHRVCRATSCRQSNRKQQGKFCTGHGESFELIRGLFKKFLLLAQVSEQNKDANFENVRYYEEADGKRLFLFFNGAYEVVATVPFDQALYDMMKKDFDFSQVKEEIIDLNWAVQFVQKAIEAEGNE